MINGKGAYNLLLGRDWIHANCCIPSMMHQCLVHWVGENIEIVLGDSSYVIASAEADTYERTRCILGEIWEKDFLKVEDGMVIDSALIQEFEGKERVIYYLSRRLVDAETRYSAIENLCLCLYFSCIKLRHYLLAAECTVICKDDVVRYMLSMPIMSGRIGKWILALTEFDLRYESAKAVKG